MEGIVAGDQNVTPTTSGSGLTTALFGKPEIPLSYMRSCLLSPKFYNVVNRVLARMSSQ